MTDLKGVQVYSDEFQSGTEEEYLPGCIYAKKSRMHILQVMTRAIDAISMIDGDFVAVTGPCIINPNVAGTTRCFRICINYICTKPGDGK